MNKHEIFSKPQGLYEEDRAPWPLWSKIAFAALMLAALYIWLTPDAPAQEPSQIRSAIEKATGGES